ncbi:MAG TPA: response regulator [Burkholderiales bacterium]|nr:response regulator [Burkholderiales bacterium]
MPDKPPTEDTPLAGKRLLVVEDEFLIALDIERMLEAAGATAIASAAQVAEALAMLDKDAPFDAVVLDLKLDRESSLPVAEWLMNAGIPFVFLTGAPTEANETSRFGNAPVVAKPFDSAALIAALTLIMSTRR